MQCAHRAAQDALRLQQRLVAVKGEQIVQIECDLWALVQAAVGTARGQVVVAPGDIGRGLIEKNVDAHLRHATVGAVGAHGRDDGIADVGANRAL